MALQANRAHIRKAALPATFHNRYDVIRIPQGFSGAQIPLSGSAEASGSAQMAKMSVRGDAVDTAKSTNAAISFEHLFSKVARAGAKFPLVHAPIGTYTQPITHENPKKPAEDGAALLGERPVHPERRLQRGVVVDAEANRAIRYRKHRNHPSLHPSFCRSSRLSSR